jgi:hypothetical protein
MKNLTQYQFDCTNAIFNFTKDNDLNKLVSKLEMIENDARVEIGGKNKTLWFKFGSDDTLATTINDFKSDLSNTNKDYMIDNFKLVTANLEIKNELKVFFS